MSLLGPENQRRLALAKERLQLVSMLGDLRSLYFGHQHVELTPDDGWTHPWKKVDALRNYLLLTCFDVLGARTQHIDFQSWLAYGKPTAAREQAIASLSHTEQAVIVAATLHRAYLEEYGSTQAFFRFMRELLPSAARDELLHSVRITEIDIAKNLGLREIDELKAKEGFLFEVRNKFTHEARDTGSPAGGLFPEWGQPVIIDGVPMMGWEPIYHIDRGNIRTEYGVRNWPAALVAAVEAGIAATQSSHQ